MVGARTASSSIAPRSGAGRRSTSIPRRSTGPVSTSSSRSRPSAGSIARAAGFGDDTAAYRASLDADPANTPSTKDELVARATEDIERAMAIAPRYFGVLPKAPATSGRSRSTRRRTRRSPTTTRRRPTARGRGSTTPTATTCPAASTPSWPRRPITRRPPATTSRSRSRWRTRTSTRSAGSAHAWSVAPMSRAGACTASGWPTRWASSVTRRSASGCSTRRPGGPPGSSSTRVSTRCAGRASARSISSRRPACRDTDAVIETDRYICWPGQALTYKIGQREIERLRAELSARDGSSFDLRAFHDAVLGHGSLPLATLAASSRTGWPPRSDLGPVPGAPTWGHMVGEGRFGGGFVCLLRFPFPAPADVRDCVIGAPSGR